MKCHVVEDSLLYGLLKKVHSVLNQFKDLEKYGNINVRHENDKHVYYQVLAYKPINLI